jgi:hypothetical protein
MEIEPVPMHVSILANEMKIIGKFTLNNEQDALELVSSC